MGTPSTSFRTLTRNLAIAATGFAVLVSGLGQVEILLFLQPMQIPMVVLTACAWGAYSLVRALTSPPGRGRAVASAEGPGGELVQKATLAGIEGAARGSEGSSAEESFARGERAFAGFNYPEAAKQYQASIAKHPTMAAYLSLGAALMNTSDFAQAAEVLYMGLQMSEREERLDFQAAFRANLGITHNRLGRLDAAQEACENAVSLFRTVGDSMGQADVMLTLGNIHGSHGDWKAAERAYQTARKRHEVAGSHIGKANALGNLGNMFMQNDDPKRALQHHQEALAIHEQIGNPLGKANALSNIGNLRFRGEEFDAALKAHDAALAIYREISAHLGEATALGNIGNVLFKQHELEPALDMYERALEIHNHIGNVLGRANTMTNIGSLLTRMGRGDEALQMLLGARRLYEETGVRTKGAEAVAELISRLDSETIRGGPPGTADGVESEESADSCT